MLRPFLETPVEGFQLSDTQMPKSDSLGVDGCVSPSWTNAPGGRWWSARGQRHGLPVSTFVFVT